MSLEEGNTSVEESNEKPEDIEELETGLKSIIFRKEGQDEPENSHLKEEKEEKSCDDDEVDNVNNHKEEERARESGDDDVDNDEKEEEGQEEVSSCDHGESGNESGYSASETESGSQSESESEEEEEETDNEENVVDDTDGWNESVEPVRVSGDGEENVETKTADEEKEEKNNPLFVPRHERFWAHDDRWIESDEMKRPPKPDNRRLWDKTEDMNWKHDMFNEEEQAPKTRKELQESKMWIERRYGQRGTQKYGLEDLITDRRGRGQSRRGRGRGGRRSLGDEPIDELYDQKEELSSKGDERHIVRGDGERRGRGGRGLNRNREERPRRESDNRDKNLYDENKEDNEKVEGRRPDEWQRRDKVSYSRQRHKKEEVGEEWPTLGGEKAQTRQFDKQNTVIDKNEHFVKSDEERWNDPIQSQDVRKQKDDRLSEDKRVGRSWDRDRRERNATTKETRHRKQDQDKMKNTQDRETRLDNYSKPVKDESSSKIRSVGRGRDFSKLKKPQRNAADFNKAFESREKANQQHQDERYDDAEEPDVQVESSDEEEHIQNTETRQQSEVALHPQEEPLASHIQQSGSNVQKSTTTSKRYSSQRQRSAPQSTNIAPELPVEQTPGFPPDIDRANYYNALALQQAQALQAQAQSHAVQAQANQAAQAAQAQSIYPSPSGDNEIHPYGIDPQQAESSLLLFQRLQQTLALQQRQQHASNMIQRNISQQQGIAQGVLPGNQYNMMSQQPPATANFPAAGNYNLQQAYANMVYGAAGHQYPVLPGMGINPSMGPNVNQYLGNQIFGAVQPSAQFYPSTIQSQTNQQQQPQQLSPQSQSTPRRRPTAAIPIKPPPEAMPE